MLKSSEDLGVDPKKADVVLPLAVALFRFTSPAMNLAVVVYVAWLFGIELTPWEMAIGLAVAIAAALSSVSLPGSISFVTSIAPIAVSMGVPVAPLGLLVAVEDRKSVVSGKSVSVRVALGGRRIITKKRSSQKDIKRIK